MHDHEPAPKLCLLVAHSPRGLTAELVRVKIRLDRRGRKIEDALPKPAA